MVPGSPVLQVSLCPQDSHLSSLLPPVPQPAWLLLRVSLRWETRFLSETLPRLPFYSLSSFVSGAELPVYTINHRLAVWYPIQTDLQEVCMFRQCRLTRFLAAASFSAFARSSSSAIVCRFERNRRYGETRGREQERALGSGMDSLTLRTDHRLLFWACLCFFTFPFTTRLLI